MTDEEKITFAARVLADNTVRFLAAQQQNAKMTSKSNASSLGTLLMSNEEIKKHRETKEKLIEEESKPIREELKAAEDNFWAALAAYIDLSPASIPKYGKIELDEEQASWAKTIADVAKMSNGAFKL